MRYVRRQTQVEAIRWVDPRQDMPKWLHDAFETGEAYYQGGGHPYITIRSPDRHAVRARIGDWIIMDIDGAITTSTDSAFRQDFDPVEYE